MVIRDGDFGGAGFGPAEDDPPLVVDADGVKAGEFSLQRLEVVARRNREVAQLASAVHLEKLSKGDAGNRGKAAVGLVEKQVFRVFVGEGLDHIRLSGMLVRRNRDREPLLEVVPLREGGRHGLLEDVKFAFQFRGWFGFGGKVEFVAAGENLLRLVRAEEVFHHGVIFVRAKNERRVVAFGAAFQFRPPIPPCAQPPA